ncbi:hypothetical protein NA57DRAFT_60688 [Rhizodiscina lignyota]|uniref:CSI2 protein n=1 Tax=Rhizodiscina lignyota TaxID=1504668 RepID=A0A9P4I7W3_9PEZI|nr:hypothetical protein NA57DRAFT_60688 [Rhizodiscina lignyota]
MRWSNGRSGGSHGAAAALSLLLLFILSTQCMAQSLSDLPNLKTASTVGGPSSSDSTSDQSSETTKAASTSNTGKATTSKATSTSAATSTDSKGSTVTGVDVTLSNGIHISSSTPASSSTTGPIFHLSNLPTVAGATNPTPTVPNTAKAPYMQKSNLPEGSVFIIVGAILGFFGACVLLWRAMVAWSLSRSVKRAAIAHHQTFDLKTNMYAAPSSAVYSQPPVGSMASMEHLAAPASNKKRSSHKHSSSLGGGTPSTLLNARASTQNLFFSPTAGAGHHSQAPAAHLSAGNRASNLLPAGYYASGSSQPAGGQSTTHINAHAAGQRGSSILNPLSDRLSGLRAESAGYQRTQSFGPSPPGSPALGPTAPSGTASRTLSPGNASSVVGQVSGPTGGLYSAPSYSSLNLNVPGGTQQPGGRTPSAYLEDLFENHGNGPRERF